MAKKEVEDSRDRREEGQGGVQLLRRTNEIVYKLLAQHERELGNYEGLLKHHLKGDVTQQAVYLELGKKYIAQGLPSTYVWGFLSGSLKPLAKTVFHYSHAAKTLEKRELSATKDIIKPYVSGLEGHLALGHSFLFFGFNGSGKTYTALLLQYEATRQNYDTYYINAKDLQLLMNRVMFSKDASVFDEIEMEHIENCELLVLDELGKESLTDNLLAQMELLLKGRTAENKATIIVTNLDVAKQEYDKRYGNSLSNLLHEKYRIYGFSSQGEFRKKTGGW
jgi:DNA replication protein DnaC